MTAAVAPLWAGAAQVEQMEPALGGSLTSYRAWIADHVGRQTSFIGALDTVALSGEPVEVLEELTPSLLRVRLPAQPDGETGYAGFMAAAHVGPDARARRTHLLRVDVMDSVGLPAGAEVELTSDGAGASVQVLSASGVRLPAAHDQLRSTSSAALAPDAVLNVARRYLGAPYVWGGLDQAGIDCSGLVHIAARIGGHVIPRDAHHQWGATRVDVTWDDLRRGDLLFFGDSASLEGIDHVGFYAGDGCMLHAPEEGRPVVLEPISDRARSRAVGVGRLPAPTSY